jgi:hypothetical protein
MLFPVLAFLAVFAAEPNLHVRKVIFHEDDIVPVNMQLGFDLQINFPKGEILKDARCANVDFFEVNASGNVLFIHAKDIPDGKEGGKKTTVNVVTSSGVVVPFIVNEISRVRGAQADLRVDLKYASETNIVQFQNQPALVPAEKIAEEKSLNDKLQKQLQESLSRQKFLIDSAALREIADLDLNGYELYDKKGKEEFLGKIHVTRDKKWTFIQVDSQDAPTVLEIKDNKPVKVPVELHEGKYVITKLLNEGELRLGKSSIKFRYVGKAS